MTETALAAQLQALYQSTRLCPLGPDEFSRAMFEAQIGCKRSEADRLVRAALDAGQIEYVGERMYRGRRVKAYRFCGELVQPAKAGTAGA